MATVNLEQYGITGSTVIAHNPSYEELYKAEIDPALTGYEVGQETETWGSKRDDRCLHRSFS